MVTGRHLDLEIFLSLFSGYGSKNFIRFLHELDHLEQEKFWLQEGKLQEGVTGRHQDLEIVQFLGVGIGQKFLFVFYTN